MLVLNTLAIHAQDTLPTETPVEIIPTETATSTEVPTETPTETLTPTQESTAEVTEELVVTTPTEVSGETEITRPTAVVPTDITPPVLTTIPVIPSEPPMYLLAHETLDNGDLSSWLLGAGWTLTSSEDGLAFQIISSSEAARYVNRTFFNAAAGARFRFDSGSVQLSIRHSPVGSYTAVLDSGGAVQLLRAGMPLSITVAPPAAADAWRTLRLSAVDNIVRVSVDGMELIAIRDDAPLPPGEIALSALMPNNSDTVTNLMLVDDFMLWVPLTELGLYPTPTPVVPTIVLPTFTATLEMPTATSPPETPAATLSAEPATEAPVNKITAEAVTPEDSEPSNQTTPQETATQPSVDTAKRSQQAAPPGVDNMVLAQASGNDNFANAVTIDSLYPNNSDSGDTTMATLETNEIRPLGCGFNVGRTVWFNFTPPSSGSYTISLAGSSFDTVLGVYTGSSVSSLTQIGCNDDASSKVLTSSLTLNGLTGGTLYRIQIGGYQQDFGLYVINIQRTGLPAAARPVLVQPVSGATTADQTPSFAWNAAAYAVAYEIQIASDKNFNNLVSRETIFTLNFTPASDLNPGLYHWRVRGLNNNGAYGAFSGARTFTIKTTAPNQSAPAVGAVVTSARPTFTFAAYGTGATYEIQFSDTNNFITDVDQTLICAATRCAPTLFSLHQGDWYWRLRAIDSLGNPTTFTGSRLFRINLLQSPNANAIFTSAASANVTFRWYAAAGAAGYTLQIDDNPDFSSPNSYSPASAAAISYTVNGLEAGNYFWRVLVTGLDNTPALAPSRTFTVSPAAPSAPTLTSPNNGATTANQLPILDWNDYSGSGGPFFSYNIDICTSSRCSPSSIIEQASGLATSEYIITNPLPAGANGSAKTYYWRVQVVNSLGVKGAFASRSLLVRTAPPELVSPLHGSSSANPTPKLTWKAYPAATYDIEIASDELFTAIVTAQTGLTTTTYTPAAPLNEGTYYWRVRALDGTALPNTTAYSPARRFTIGPTPPPAPALVSPNHSSTTADQTPTFDWNDVSGAASYCLLVDNQSNFTSPEISTCAPANSEFTPANPLDTGTYFWKVQSVNSLGGTGSYSAVRRVTIQLAGPAPGSPASGAVITATRPRLTWAAYPGSTLYNVRIDTDAACDSSIGSFSTSTNSFTAPILDQGTYYWCVQARDYLNNLTNFGAVRSFTISILSKPVNNAIISATTPTFQWAAAAAGARYCLDIDDDDAFEADDPVFLTICDLTSTSYAPALANGTWYWRVRVSTDGGTTYTPSSPPFRRLTISPAAPAAPGLSLPGNGSVVWTTTPLLSWKPSASGSPVNYLIEVDDDAKFSTPNFTGVVAAADCSASTCSILVDPSTLTLNTTYYWRVRARNTFDVEGKSSSVFRFRIQNPIPPSLTSPVQNSTTTTNRPTFRWSRPAGAVRFDIRLDTNASPANVPAANLTANAFQPPAPLIATTYFWQVQAYDSVGTPSGWSAIFSIKIISPTSSAPVPNRFGPGSTNTPHTVRLSWGPVSWVNPGGWYEIMIDDHSNFSSPLYQTPRNASILPAGTQFITEGTGGFPTLVNGTYYWRVRACDNTGRCGHWSSTGVFVVER